MLIRGKDRAREVCKRVNPINAKQNKRVFKEREVFLSSEIITSGETSYRFSKMSNQERQS